MPKYEKHLLKGPHQETDKAEKQGHIGVFWGKYLNVEVPRDKYFVMAEIYLGVFRKHQAQNSLWLASSHPKFLFRIPTTQLEKEK